MSTIKIKATPRDFFLYLGMIAALYASAISFLTIAFQSINELFPDILEYLNGADLWALRTGIASLVVAFPLYLILSRLVYRDLKRDPDKREVWIRRWLIYFTLFASGVTLAIVAIVLVNTFLQGELTTRFVLKIISVAVVASAIFRYYLYDLKRNIQTSEHLVSRLSWVTAVVVVGSIFGGVIIAGTPTSQRLIRLDEQRISHLQSIQDQVLYIYDRDGALPPNLESMVETQRYFEVPKDPLSGQEYEYKLLTDKSFELCATFDAVSDENSKGRYNYEPRAYPLYTGEKYMVEGGSWEHGLGRTCFERVIRPNQNSQAIEASKPLR